MVKNCDTKWDSCIKIYQPSIKYPEPHLLLRYRTYYCRLELPKINKKRKFLRFSLHTENYYWASQMIKDIQKYIQNVYLLDHLYNYLVIEKMYTDANDSTRQSYVTVLGNDNDVELLKRIKSLYDECTLDDFEYYKLTTRAQGIISGDAKEKVEHFNPWNIDGGKIWKRYICKIDQVKKVLDKVGNIIIQIHNIIYHQATISAQNQILLQTLSTQMPVTKSIIHHTVKEVMDRLEIDLKRKVGKDTLKRKIQDIQNVLSNAGISVDDNYDKLNNQKTINEIETSIKGIVKIGVKAINRRILSMNEFIKSAHKLEPDYYRLYTIEQIYVKKSAASNQPKTYLPFTKEELIKMFDPKYEIFKKHPQIFFSVLMGLYCGCRSNGATTLRYTDIVEVEGIKCFDFKLDDDSNVEDPDYDPIKKLKTAASVRIVPIHHKIIELGFLEYINKYQKRNENLYENFIFSRTLTKNKKYNKHFMRPLFEHLKALGIKKDRWKAFHSFRTNINKALRDCGVEQTMRNSIIGWSGKSTPERNYSNNELREVQRELEKLHYDFLDEEFTQIAKDIMGKK